MFAALITLFICEDSNNILSSGRTDVVPSEAVLERNPPVLVCSEMQSILLLIEFGRDGKKHVYCG